MQNLIHQINYYITDKEFDNNKLGQLYYELTSTKSNIARIFINKLKEKEPLSYDDILIILDDLHFEETDNIEYEVHILDLILTQITNNRIIGLYLKAISTIVEDLSSRGIERFDADLAFLAKNCCETLKEINKNKDIVFINNSLEILASLYINHIEYLREYKSEGYDYQDYNDFYKNVLTLNPDNVTALKWFLENQNNCFL